MLTTRSGVADGFIEGSPKQVPTTWPMLRSGLNPIDFLSLDWRARAAIADFCQFTVDFVLFLTGEIRIHPVIYGG
jgi:hypothetical protein